MPLVDFLAQWEFLIGERFWGRVGPPVVVVLCGLPCGRGGWGPVLASLFLGVKWYLCWHSFELRLEIFCGNSNGGSVAFDTFCSK